MTGGDTRQEESVLKIFLIPALVFHGVFVASQSFSPDY
jgi:hypothetical protein